MDFTSYNSIITPTGIITGIATAWYSVQKVVREIHKSRKNASDKILEEAKDFDKQLKDKLEARIDLLDNQINVLKENVAKDLANAKDSHSIELRALSDKIEALRDELKTQSVGILNLLTKLVDK